IAEASNWPAIVWGQQVEDFATFVAVLGSEDVGVVRGARHGRPDVRELISMWVDPAARRKGVGSKLIDAVVEWAKRDGAVALILDVAERNNAATAFYALNGFVLDEGSSMGERAVGEVRMIRAIG